MFLILGLIASTIVAVLGYSQARAFVTRRLRYVDAVHTPIAPFAAGAIAAVVALPIVAILPIVGVGTALSFGLSVGAGVAAGSKDVRNSLPRN